ncbi:MULTISPECIES: FAD-dependent oxidoreductase [unclassified Bacillus (in: firmicutes)]|uniref:FAD-dependent oxidoreductase n=1 Tax=unclassified Bacillus (in: firmicutes) TaxID=185979 RepID=UPI001BE76B4D|nr:MULTISPECIES: FAD-dependent oxidoreductase [unclassified Bacillus (in: firmicutes)]MBT2618990.1 NAD(P)-binding domain-containing protein [Bacillus sp. ISL-78]MBT2630652.1 NAD(P)-binding domain-containing protein [Bacillus sp. ISL-101]
MMVQFDKNALPVAIIGGGPVGLAAAAHLLKKGEKFIVLEAGDSVGSSMLEWGHVRMFSPWQYNIDKVAKELLENAGWSSPNEEALPTGRKLVEEYLLPLSNLPEIKDQIILQAKVVGVAKKAHDKLKTGKRDTVPFQLYVEVNGDTTVIEAKAVLDSSGTWANPNPILSNGIWTNAERQLHNQIHYGIPNVEKLENRYQNKTTVVIGSGHSAINALLDLAPLQQKFTDTKIYWVLRKKQIHEVYGGQENDGLAARGELGIRIQELVESGRIHILTPFHINGVYPSNGQITVVGELDGEEFTLGDIDEIVVSTGFRPDTSFLNEVRINLDSSVESIEALAPLIDPNIHSCGTVRPHGEQELRHPEKNFYIVGMKSYGRAPTFLLATGYEQVRSVVAYLTGDVEGAKEVHLELPETGVCSVNLASNSCDSDLPANETQDGSCCGKPFLARLEIKNNSCCE